MTKEYSYIIELENEESTLCAGKALAQVLENEKNINLLLLFGTLGAGKTTFTRGFVSALEAAHLAEVASPTFALVNHYPSVPPVVHADMYRLAEMADFSDNDANYPSLPEDLEQVLFEDEDFSGYILIEWAEFLDKAQLPKERLDIYLKIHNNIHVLELKGHLPFCQELFLKFEKALELLVNSL